MVSTWFRHIDEQTTHIHAEKLNGMPVPWHVCSFLVAIYWRKSAFIVFTLNKNICHVGISFLSECLSESVPMTCMFSMSSFRVIFVYLHCIALHSIACIFIQSQFNHWIHIKVPLESIIWFENLHRHWRQRWKKNMKWIV